MWRRIDQKLRSPRLTIVLICIIGVASIVGTIPVEFLETGAAGEIVSGLLRAVGADHVYRTWWYTSLLAFLAFLMIYCSLRRAPFIIRGFTLIPDASVWSREDQLMTHSFTISAPSTKTVREKVVHVLRDKGYHARAISAESGDEAASFAKGRAGILGPPVVHLGLVIAFIGGLLTHNFGTIREINLGEGEAYLIPGTQATVRLEKFSIIHHPGTREPEEYVSTLMVTEKDSAPAWHMLRVNQPLIVSGNALYQVRYRPEVRYVSLGVFEPESRNPIGIVKLIPGEKVEVTGQDFTVELKEIIPDFAVDSKNNVFSRSPYFLNPAAKLSVYSRGRNAGPAWTGWAFKDMFPSHDSSAGPLLFVIKRVSLKYYSGVKIVNDPGVGIAYLGFALLVAGSLVSCYLFWRFVRVEFGSDKPNGTVYLRVSGYSVKNHPDFLYEWNGLIAQFRKSIGE